MFYRPWELLLHFWPSVTVAPKATVAAVWHSEMCVPVLTSSRSWCHSLNSPVAVLVVVFILRHLQHIRTELAASPRVPKMPHLPQSVVFVSCCHRLVQLVWITGESMTHNSIWIQGVYASGFWILGQKKRLERSAQCTWVWQKREMKSRNWREKEMCCGLCPFEVY